MAISVEAKREYDRAYRQRAHVKTRRAAQEQTYRTPEVRKREAARLRERRATEPDFRESHNCATAERTCKRRYGITLSQKADLLAAQGGRCAACRTDDPGRAEWNVDHDHACCPGQNTCGKCIRGILCKRCNMVLGHVDDNIQMLAALACYLLKGARDA